MLHLLWILSSEEVPSLLPPSSVLLSWWPNFEGLLPGAGCRLSVDPPYFELPVFWPLVLCWQASLTFHCWPRGYQVFLSPKKLPIRGIRASRTSKKFAKPPLQASLDHLQPHPVPVWHSSPEFDWEGHLSDDIVLPCRDLKASAINPHSQITKNHTEHCSSVISCLDTITIC